VYNSVGWLLHREFPVRDHWLPLATVGTKCNTKFAKQARIYLESSATEKLNAKLEIKISYHFHTRVGCCLICEIRRKLYINYVVRRVCEHL
jgi:hypothetical protein